MQIQGSGGWASDCTEEGEAGWRWDGLVVDETVELMRMSGQQFMMIFEFLIWATKWNIYFKQ